MKDGSIEVKRRQGRRRKQLQDYLKERMGYWKFKEETLNRNPFGTRFGGGLWIVIKME